jgi:hypothetical protein
MKGLPFELLLILFIGAIALFNFIKQRAAGLRPPEATQAEPEPDDITEALWGRGPLDRTTMTEPETPAPAPRRMSAAADSATPADRRRRFDRQALLGTRRRVQDAFVVATILGRCRADEPHEER